MDNPTKTLLTGAAIGTLAVAPAVAGGVPNIHLAVSNGDHALVLKNGSVHSKTDIRNPRRKVATQTEGVVFTYTGQESTMYKKHVFLGHGTTWYTTTTKNPKVCKTIPKQKGRVRAQPKGLKISPYAYQSQVTYTSSKGAVNGPCKGVLTFIGPDAYQTTKIKTHHLTKKFTFTDYRLRYKPENKTNSKLEYNLYAYQDWTVVIE
jgi:hypothetical protein